MSEPSLDKQPQQPSDHDQVIHYLDKHQQGLTRRLRHWRDEQLARHALKVAGEPGLVLDLPSGAGRFWPVLAEHSNRVILAADHSPAMLAAAESRYSDDMLKRIKMLQTSAFSIDLSANAVDCIFCMRLFYHVADSQQRLAILREFHRVTRDTVIIALWVDGNIKAWRRKRLERYRESSAGSAGPRHNRFVVSKTTIETEFDSAGFKILGHHDFLPGYAMWRVYVLRKNS